jgi:hypothetical protein
LHNLYCFWKNTIIQQNNLPSEYEQLPIRIILPIGNIREVTLIDLGIIALIAALAGIRYGVITNHVTAT